MTKHTIKRAAMCLLISVLLLASTALASPEWVDLSMSQLDKLSAAGETVIEPLLPVPEHVRWLLEIAREEIYEWLKKYADTYTWYNEFIGESGMTNDFIEGILG